jgi:hypothetical protein
MRDSVRKLAGSPSAPRNFNADPSGSNSRIEEDKVAGLAFEFEGTKYEYLSGGSRGEACRKVD